MLGQCSNEGFKHVICAGKQDQAQEHKENANTGIGFCKVIEGADEKRGVSYQP